MIDYITNYNAKDEGKKYHEWNIEKNNYTLNHCKNYPSLYIFIIYIYYQCFNSIDNFLSKNNFFMLLLHITNHL